MFPVEVAYLQEPTPDYVRTAAEISWSINLQVSRIRHVQPVLIFFPQQKEPGDILVFLTGRDEIERCLEEILEMIPK